MTTAADLIVVGAGPAGSMAACAAAEQGLSVVLIDEASKAGGQIFRASADGLMLAAHDADAIAGEQLRARVAQGNMVRRFGCRVWSVSRGFRVDIASDDGHEAFVAPRLIAATGAYERVVPFPGWTLPGVIGLAAATILIKSQGMLPGRRLVVAGCGPLLFQVAAKAVASGAEVVALVDLSGRSDWLSALPGLMRRPRLMGRGAGWVLDILKARVPIYFRHVVRAASGSDRVERVEIGPVDAAGAECAGQSVSFDVDSLIVGHGLVPGAEIPRLLRAEMTFHRRRGGWVPVTDSCGRTHLPGLFAIGDGAGVKGAEPALLAGELAGLTAAIDAGRASAQTADAVDRRSTHLLRALSSYAPFADGVASLMALRQGQVSSIGPETIVCRCEDVTRSDIETAAQAGAADVNQMKQFTRCGMGPCQGRLCGDVAAEILAASRKVSREEVGYWTGRPPLRPVPLGTLVGAFDYSDIPIPRPAPL